MTPIIFCSDPLDSSRPHRMWEEEVVVASSLGEVHLLDHEALLKQKTDCALRRLPKGTGETPIIYHGWMMIPQIYENFYRGLENKGYKLINSPQQYLGCHHIVNWYPIIKKFTPPTSIVYSENLREILEVVQSLNDSPLLIKDFVSSQKHAWHQACFIPANSDVITVTKIIATFLAMQQQVDGIQGGIVLRKFVPLRSVGVHPRSGMPISQEFRAFILSGKVISLSRYWEDGSYTDDRPPMSVIRKIANRIIKQIGSNFFTIDLAQKENGDWICIEVGDGQVSSLPDNGDKKEFYHQLMNYGY